ncbi:MAG TPA: hypothetical protein VFG19_17050 [Geobacteraceae bacterium]|nr:hypothetical protein [Geobacteraceae bacterium]
MISNRNITNEKKICLKKVDLIFEGKDWQPRCGIGIEMDKVKVLESWPKPEAGAPEPQMLANENRLALRYYTQDEKIAVIFFPLVYILNSEAPEMSHWKDIRYMSTG